MKTEKETIGAAFLDVAGPRDSAAMGIPIIAGIRGIIGDTPDTAQRVIVLLQGEAQIRKVIEELSAFLPKDRP